MAFAMTALMMVMGFSLIGMALTGTDDYLSRKFRDDFKTMFSRKRK